MSKRRKDGDKTTTVGASGLPNLDDFVAETTTTRQTETNQRVVVVPSSQRIRPTLTVLDGFDAGRIVSLHRDQLVIGRAADCDLRLEQAGVSRHHARLRLDDAVVVCEDLGSKNGTFVDGSPVKERPLRAGDIINVGPNVSVRFALMTAEEERLARELYDSSRRDPLTSAFNRRYFSERLHAELAYTARHRGVVSVVMFDLDHFKHLNDTHGHAAGDAVLRAVVQTAFHVLRSEDVLARVGGEEFAYLLRGVGSAGARIAAERLRSEIGERAVDHDGRALRITMSAGVATSDEPDAETATKLLALADARLYRAKRAGRDRVCGAGDG